MTGSSLHIGTCSWKYDSWEGLVYSKKKPVNYLQEHSQNYNTVEVDQWFWSLFAEDKVVLPKPSVVREYATSVPQNFMFCIKIPNSITLTHYYKKPTPNKHFLSVDLMNRFLDSIVSLHDNLGPLIFQFEYLNKQKMSGAAEFMDRLGGFIEKMPADFIYCVELRNPNWLENQYFDFLTEEKLHHVFLQGYYMPSIFDLYRKHREQIRDVTVIRLHGPNRKGIEDLTCRDWSQIVAPKESDIENLVKMVADLQSRNVEPHIYVNNHFEGSAPRTIAKIEALI